MPETGVAGGTSGGPGNIATVTDLASLARQVVFSTQLRLTSASTLTRPANTTAYAAGQLVASSTTAGSIVVPSLAVALNNAGSGVVRRLRLRASQTSGLGAANSFGVDLWTAAPTFTNGDGGAYVVATGSASWLGTFTFGSMVQAGDGAYGAAAPDVGQELWFVCGAGSSNLYWSLFTNGPFPPTSVETFVLTAELAQD